MEFKIERNLNGWKIEDLTGNYLMYLEDHKVAHTLYGVVDGKEVTQADNIRTNWKRSGRGRISDKTWDKIKEMDDYFYNNYHNI